MNALQAYSGSLLTAAVIIIAVVLALLAYRMFNNRLRGGVGARLGVSEYQDIDKSRKLVLVRRDDVEHLLLIGGPQDLLIESRIESPLSASSGVPFQNGSMPVSMKPANVQPMRAAPRPAVFGGNRPPLRTVENTDSNLRPPDRNLAQFKPERE
jgi:hypothetical protein